MKRLVMFAGMLIWSNMLEADVIPWDYGRSNSIVVDWYVPIILMVIVLGIVSIYVLRRLRKREESEKRSGSYVQVGI